MAVPKHCKGFPEGDRNSISPLLISQNNWTEGDPVTSFTEQPTTIVDRGGGRGEGLVSSRQDYESSSVWQLWLLQAMLELSSRVHSTDFAVTASFHLVAIGEELNNIFLLDCRRRLFYFWLHWPRRHNSPGPQGPTSVEWGEGLGLARTALKNASYIIDTCCCWQLVSSSSLSFSCITLYSK